MKKTTFRLAAFFALVFLFVALSVEAQNVPPAETKAPAAASQSEGDSDSETRIKQLEKQVETMRAELDELKKLLTPNKSEAARNESPAANKPPSSAAAADSKPVTPTSENKQNALPKQPLGVDVGSARLTPYGTIYFNAFGNSGGTNNSDVPTFATPTGTGNFSASARQTRLGLRLEGARIGSARLAGFVEADFYGGFPSIAVGENFGVVRLRLANARLDWERTSVVVGQDWMVFAPVNPTSLAAAAIPQMAAAGNNWARLPQFRVERKLNANFTFQGALLAPQTGDFSTAAGFFLQPTSGSQSRTPFFQSRIAFAGTGFFGVKKPGSVGISGHYGRSRVLTGAQNTKNEIESVGVALDWNVPLAERLTLTGEAFFGRNLGGFQGGVFQSYNNDFVYRNGSTVTSGGVRSIATRGGWMQLGLTPGIWRNRLGLYASVGIDDPRDGDLASRTPRDFRRQNFSYAFDAIYKFTPQFQVGAEFRRFQTLYVLSGRQSANHINLSAAYSF